jgi:hypothetical protein
MNDILSRNDIVTATLHDLLCKLTDDFRYVAQTKHWIHWNNCYWENGDQLFADAFDIAIEDHSINYDVDKGSIRRSLKEKLKITKTNINSDFLLVTPTGTIDIPLFKVSSRIGHKDSRQCPIWLRPSIDYKDRYITMCTKASYKWREKKEPKEYKKILLENLSQDVALFDFYNIIDSSILLGGLYHEYFYIYWGPGRNGKTLLLDIKRELLGSYSSTLSPYFFKTKKNDINKDLYSRKEKRLVVIDEINRMTKYDTSLIKRITGKNHFESVIDNEAETDFYIKFKCFFDTNHLPCIGRDESLGFWERVVIFPFRDVLPATKRINNLLERIIEKELDDIFTFIIDDYLPKYLACVQLPKEETDKANEIVKQNFEDKKVVFCHKNLEVPEKVIKAVEYYKFSVDPYSDFLANVCLKIEPNIVRAMSFSRYGMRESFSIFTEYTRKRLHSFMELFCWDEATESFYFSDIHLSERLFFQTLTNNGYYSSILNGTNTWTNLYIRQAYFYPDNVFCANFDNAAISLNSMVKNSNKVVGNSLSGQEKA